MADVLQLPVVAPDCRDCAHSSWSADRGTYCHVYAETVISEAKAAADCESFEVT